MADVLHRTTVECRVADDAWTLAEHHRIREAVFVREQRLFQGSDRDGRDDEAATIRVLGFRDGVAGGAVRLYPLDDAGHWQGDRLAVLLGTRGRGLGAPLVRFAVATAANRGGRLMTAHIQPRNVPYFERLGWSVSGEREIYVGVPHVPMAIDLTATAR
ncbi:MAG TPA: MSMEG_0567/Sll0786 family nitrogen starvation N-acetyltransferase [Acidimicrobiales bacterium]|nr:MSMEG_0567/Sll0786 family nitrogen starvation N-acetyltransferase [Acidimicrobiales bacterium]